MPREKKLHRAISRSMVIDKRRNLKNDFGTPRQRLELAEAKLEHMANSSKFEKMRSFFPNSKEAGDLFYLTLSKVHGNKIKGIHALRAKILQKLNKNTKRYSNASQKIISSLPINNYPLEKTEIYNMSKFIIEKNNKHIQETIKEEIRTIIVPESPKNDHEPGVILSGHLVKSLKSATELFLITATKKEDIESLKEIINNNQKNKYVRNYLLNSF